MTSNVPLFHAEGPAYYQAAYDHNHEFAEPIGGSYFTTLTDSEESNFRDWVKNNQVWFDVNAAITDYDMRGYWQQTHGGNWAGGEAHFPDTWKTPWDTTFSNESRYATSDCPFAWHGELLIDTRDGQVIYNEILNAERRRVPGRISAIGAGIAFDADGNAVPEALLADLTSDSKKRGGKKGAKGLQADVTDLVLRSGKQLTIEVGGVETPTPNLVRDMEASSALSVDIFDPGLEVLEKTLLSEKFDAFVDGLRFRYIGATKSGPTVTLNFEDKTIARLRELSGPKSAFRAKQTRANFICGLVEELEPEVPIYCPQRHEKQPLEKEEELPSSERQSKKSAKEAKETPGGKGVGDTKGLKVKGETPSPEQKELLETALRIADEGGAPFQCSVAVVAALIDETDAGAVMPGNVLSGLGPGGAPIGTPQEEISGFLFGKPAWTGTTAVGFYKEHPGATFYEIAQAVQASEFPDGSNYAAFGDEARQWVEAYGGATGSALSDGSTSEEVTEPYTFKVGKKETYWGAIQRLAKEVEWRAFVVEGRFFFISEPELSRGQVQLAIEREPGKRHPRNRGILEVDFNFNVNKVTNEVTVTAMAEHWEVRPGGVVTVAGYGPASIGPGDAPSEDGATIGLSSGVKASTHEGKGRYLVSRIETGMTGDVNAREVTVTLVKPTQPLPEKRATKRTINSGGSTTPAAEGAPGEYVNPFPHGEWERSRIDQGVDFVNNSASSKVLAIGKGQVVAIGAPGWPAGGGVLYKLLDGPHQGDYIYAYENVRPHVSVGDQIQAGQTIATMLGTGYPWIELGFSDSSGVPNSHAEYTEGLETISGKEMSKLLDSLGAP